MKHAFIYILLFTTVAGAQPRTDSGRAIPPDSVATISVDDLKTVLKYMEDGNWLSRDYNRAAEAFGLLIQLRNSKFLKPKSVKTK